MPSGWSGFVVQSNISGSAGSRGSQIPLQHSCSCCPPAPSFPLLPALCRGASAVQRAQGCRQQRGPHVSVTLCKQQTSQLTHGGSAGSSAGLLPVMGVAGCINCTRTGPSLGTDLGLPWSVLCINIKVSSSAPSALPCWISLMSF